MRFMLYQVLTVAAATLASATGALASDALDAHLAQLDAKVGPRPRPIGPSSVL